MKTTRKFLGYTGMVLLSLFLFVGCSSDDDNGSKNASDTPDFTLLETPIILPSALENHSDPHAQQLVGEIDMVSSYQSYAAFTQVPPGAEVSHQPIQATGSLDRPATTNNSVQYTVYTYSYLGYITIAYQFSVQNGMDVVEIFYSSTETNGFIKYIDIRQTQDGKSGTMKFLGLYMDDYVYQWDWQENPDGSLFITMHNSGFNINYEMMYYPDQSGYLKYYWDGQLQMEFHWNANGSGTWVDYSTSTNGSWS